MDYRDNRQRWAESHQVVHFYAGQWCTFTPALTLHKQAGSRPHPGRWEAAANARLHGTSIPLSVRGQVRPAGQGQRQRQGRGTGRLHPAELPGPRPAGRELRGPQRCSRGTVPPAPDGAAAGSRGDDRRAPRAGPGSSATATPGSIRCLRQASRARELAVAGPLPRQRLLGAGGLNVPPPSWPGIAQYRAEPHVSKEIRRIALNIQFAPGHAM